MFNVQSLRHVVWGSHPAPLSAVTLITRETPRAAPQRVSRRTRDVRRSLARIFDKRAPSRHQLTSQSLSPALVGRAAWARQLRSLAARRTVTQIGGSEDGSVLFWDIVDAMVVGRLNAHTKVRAGDYRKASTNFVCWFWCVSPRPRHVASEHQRPAALPLPFFTH